MADERLNDEERRLAEIVDRVLESTAAVEPSADFLARVRRRVDEDKEREDRGAWRIAMWATLAAVLVGLVVGGLRRDHPAPKQTAEVQTPAPVAPTAVTSS